MFSALRSRIHSFRGEKRRPGDPDEVEKPPRLPYGRPHFLDLSYETYHALGYEDAARRMILVPKDPGALPWNAGYAECVSIAAGKRKHNEDQSAVGAVKLDHQLTTEELNQFFPGHQGNVVASLRGLHFGVFDGHAGPDAALLVADQLTNHIQEKLAEVRKDLFILALREHKKREERANNSYSSMTEDSSYDEDNVPKLHRAGLNSLRGTKFDPYDHITLDELVIGALEAAFVAMDEHIGLERTNFRIDGGCCVLVALFFCGRLFVANAGDCRAVAYRGDEVHPMSTDWTPERDVNRIISLGLSNPELLQGVFTTNRFLKPLCENSVGEIVFCKKPYTNGWVPKVVTEDDIRLLLVSGDGKESRLMHTLGVSRSLGDFDVKESHTKVPLKPFISCLPEVKVLDLCGSAVTDKDVLVMGCDGLWDVVTNRTMGQVVRAAFAADLPKEHSLYSQVAYSIVLHSRGKLYTNSLPESDSPCSSGSQSQQLSPERSNAPSGRFNPFSGSGTGNQPEESFATGNQPEGNSGNRSENSPTRDRSENSPTSHNSEEGSTTGDQAENSASGDQSENSNTGDQSEETALLIGDSAAGEEDSALQESGEARDDGETNLDARSAGDSFLSNGNTNKRSRTGEEINLADSSPTHMSRASAMKDRLSGRWPQNLPMGWRMADNRELQSSLDDITAVVIPLDKAYEYTHLYFTPSPHKQ